MGSSGETAILYARLMDGQKDVTRWLSDAQSNEERLYLRRMQVCLGDLLQILDRTEIRHRIASHGTSGEPPSPSSQPQWNKNVTAFLNAFQGARDVRGDAVGDHLERLAISLGEQTGQSKRVRIDARMEAQSTALRPQNENRPRKSVERRSTGPATDKARESFLRPILDGKGFSVHDWAKAAGVDFHTANDYLNGMTNPYKSTRKKLADAIGLRVEDLPT